MSIPTNTLPLLAKTSDQMLGFTQIIWNHDMSEITGAKILMQKSDGKFIYRQIFIQNCFRLFHDEFSMYLIESNIPYKIVSDLYKSMYWKENKFFVPASKNSENQLNYY